MGCRCDSTPPAPPFVPGMTWGRWAWAGLGHMGMGGAWAYQAWAARGRKWTDFVVARLGSRRPPVQKAIKKGQNAGQALNILVRLTKMTGKTPILVCVSDQDAG